MSSRVTRGKALFRMSTGFDNATYSLMNTRGVGASSRIAMGVACSDATSDENCERMLSVNGMDLSVRSNDGMTMQVNSCWDLGAGRWMIILQSLASVFRCPSMIGDDG